MPELQREVQPRSVAEIQPGVEEVVEDEDRIKAAREQIREALEHGVKPRMTVKRKRLQDLRRRGLVPHASWTGHWMLVGTLGRDPYLPAGEDRVVLEIDCDAEHLIPRFTGKDKGWHGVVGFLGPIAPEQIRSVDVQ